jgi:hypothetical protein
MERKYSEVDVTWASVEYHNDYDKVVWSMNESGIPRYTFFDENYKKIEFNF